MRFGKITIQDLPLDLRKRLISISGPLGWRPITLERMFANLEAQIIFARNNGDYAHWKQCEDIGNKIREWISADKKREEKYLNDCDLSYKQKEDDPYFYR